MQHKDFNSFLLWSRDIPEAYLSGIVEVALDFATSTGLGEVQGILPDLPGVVAGELHRVCCVTSVTTRSASTHNGRALMPELLWIQHHSLGTGS